MDKNFYLNLIPTENSRKEKFMAYLDMVLENVVQFGTLSQMFGRMFDVDNAVGAQLDIIGECVGVGRLLDYVPANGSRVLDDSEFRLVIKLKIARNEWDGENDSIDGIYKAMFTDTVFVRYEDNQDMSVVYSIYGLFTPREAEILNATNTLLVPAGVSKSVVVIGDEPEAVYYIDTSVCGIETQAQVRML